MLKYLANLEVIEVENQEKELSKELRHWIEAKNQEKELSHNVKVEVVNRVNELKSSLEWEVPYDVYVYTFGLNSFVWVKQEINIEQR